MATHSALNLSKEMTIFGPIHLRVSNLEKAITFWTEIVGLKLRVSKEFNLELGSENTTLVVLHETALNPYSKGYSGLYHFAIHVSDELQLARIINRLDKKDYPYSPIDHTISKAIYLKDYEGITVEFTLETPYRNSSDDSANNRTQGPKPLNVAEIMKSLMAMSDDNNRIDNKSYVGHIHLYAKNVEESNDFYKKLGFIQNTYKPSMTFADLGSGGDFGHRIALNSWHGTNRPQAPEDNAGLVHFEIRYHEKQNLQKALETIQEYKQSPEGYWVTDPSGNKILLN